MTIFHSCMRKAAIIFERTGILVGHDQISLLCEIWGCQDTYEFMDHLNALTDEELKKEIEKLKKKRKILDAYLAQEQRIYA